MDFGSANVSACRPETSPIDRQRPPSARAHQVCALVAGFGCAAGLRSGLGLRLPDGDFGHGEVADEARSRMHNINDRMNFE